MTETYYEDGRITYDEAERKVHEFIEEKADTRSTVSTKDVCRAMGIEWSNHNQRRVYDVLEAELPESDWGNKFEVQR